jgi:hypothetical protein
MVAKKKLNPVEPSAAYKSEIARLFRTLNDPKAQANAKAKREKAHAERIHVAQKKNQKAIEYLHNLVAKEQARAAHNEAALARENARLTRERGPGVLFPCKDCGEYCTVPGYITEPYNTCDKT